VVAAAATPPVANVHCWGRGSQGQLGRGGLPNSGAPAPVTGGGAYRGVATGGDHSCGIREDGALLCWGWNARGQLGLGVTFDVDEPLFVPGGLRWSALALGAEHSCALTEGGDAYCWGRGDSGQLGQGTTDDALLPVRVGGPVRFRALAAGREHTCGLTADGAAYCWGNGLYGRVGVDPVNGPFLLPTPVAAPTEGAVRFDQLAAGALHTCGLATEGTVFCWGFGGFGQLGTGATLDASVPTPVARPPDPSGP
jgi:alpha-tubulin suppressor-like RCC1 family protein